MPKSALPPHLQNRPHEDFPKFLQWIPRGWTAFAWGKPQMVKGHLFSWDFVLEATEDGMVGQFWPKPITAPGTWQFSRFPEGPWFAWYFAFTTKGGTHFRIGARWDDVDSYVEFPTLAVKRGV